MRYPVLMIFSWLVMVLLPAMANSTPVAGFFDTVKTVSLHSRIDVADELYERKLKRMDSSFVITSLKQLIAIADSLDDQVLKCYAYSTFGDYYARIRGFNPLSTQLHYQAIDIAKGRGGPSVALFMSDFKLGRYYYNFKKYPNAFEFLLRANYLAKEEGYGDDVESDELLFYLARAYHETGDYQNAAYYYTESLKYKDVFNGTFRTIQSYNGLAAIAQNNKDFAGALYYLNLIIKFTSVKKDSTWQGLAKGFAGNIYFLENKYDSAKTFLTEGYLSDTQHHEWVHAATCILNLAAISVTENNMQLAGKYLADAKTCMGNTNSLANRKQLYEVLVKYYKKKATLTLLLGSPKNYSWQKIAC